VPTTNLSLSRELPWLPGGHPWARADGQVPRAISAIWDKHRHRDDHEDRPIVAALQVLARRPGDAGARDGGHGRHRDGRQREAPELEGRGDVLAERN